MYEETLKYWIGFQIVNSNSNKQRFKTILISTQIVTANHSKTLICLIVSFMNLTNDEHLPQPNAQIPGFE
jgi:hypothetical protein